jgi:hypothetical protein
MHRALSTLATDAAGKLDVLWLVGDRVGVVGAVGGVLEETNEVSLRGLLESSNSGALEAEVGLEVLGNLANEALEWQLADQELGRLLVTTDLTKSDGTWAITMGLLDTTGCWGALAGGLGGQLLAWGLATSRLAGSLLGTSHCGLLGLKRENDAAKETVASCFMFAALCSLCCGWMPLSVVWMVDGGMERGIWMVDG